MALKMWASSTANALIIFSSVKYSPAFSLSRCFSTVLDGLKYANSHEWVKHEGSVATIGITDHAQEPRTSVTKGSGFGAVESVKATKCIFIFHLMKINSTPYEEGWMIKVKPVGIRIFNGFKGIRQILQGKRRRALIRNLENNWFAGINEVQLLLFQISSCYLSAN